jgi:hypothetical protein
MTELCEISSSHRGEYEVQNIFFFTYNTRVLENVSALYFLIFIYIGGIINALLFNIISLRLNTLSPAVCELLNAI